MLIVSKTIYNLVLSLYHSVIFIASPFNKKANQWIIGRKDVFKNLQTHYHNKNGIQIWMHCASLGEFEQGRPVLEKLHTQIPGCKILLTFFSPSGFEFRRNYAGADYVSYLPMDNKKNAIRFIQIVKPDIALFVKYEYWYHFLKQLNAHHIPVLLFSSVFRMEQPFFQWYGSLYREMLRLFNKIFVQTNQSKILLTKIGIDSTIAGDTRFDRVIHISQQNKEDKTILEFLKDSQAIIGGSTWAMDEKILKQVFADLLQPAEFKMIIAPHDVSKFNIARIESFFGNNCSKYSDGYIPSKSILIIDTIGKLAESYRFAKYVHVGGGFSKGLHNTLEAAVYGKPIFFGPNNKKFHEAQALIEEGAAFEIHNTKELKEKIQWFENNPAEYNKACNTAREYVIRNTGGTEKIVEFIRSLIP